MDRRLLLLATSTSAENMNIVDTTDNDNDSSIFSLTTLKVLLLVTIFLLGGVSVWAPFHLTTTTITKPGILFSWGNMMASGVLLAAGLVHQLADSTQVLQHHYPSYPWAMFLCGLTFVIFMVVEESLHLVLEGNHNDKDNHKSSLSLHTMMHGGGGFETDHHSRHNHHHHDDDDSPTSTEQHQHQHQRDRIKSPTTTATNHHHHPPTEDQPLLPPRQAFGSGGGAEQQRAVQSTGSSYYTTRAGATTSSSCCGGIHTTSFLPQDLLVDRKLEQEASSSSSNNDPAIIASRHSISLPLPRQSSTTLMEGEHNHHHHHHHHHKEHLELHLHGSIVASGILLWALSIHSFLAGLSIGIEQDLQAIVGTALAILAHKALEGFCLGSSLVNSSSHHGGRTMVLVLGLLFASATPLGILVGQVLQGLVFLNVVGIAIIQAVVAGTFLYISIVEIGAKELLVCRHSEDDGTSSSSPAAPSSSHPFQSRLEFGKLICFVLGFLAMSGLAAFI